MSASEELKALGTLPQETRFWPSEHVKVVWDALPQIVAVVEAAEQAVTCAWMDKATDEQNLELKRRADAIPAALSALEEALT